MPLSSSKHYTDVNCAGV